MDKKVSWQWQLKGCHASMWVLGWRSLGRFCVPFPPPPPTLVLGMIRNEVVVVQSFSAQPLWPTPASLLQYAHLQKTLSSPWHSAENRAFFNDNWTCLFRVNKGWQVAFWQTAIFRELIRINRNTFIWPTFRIKGFKASTIFDGTFFSGESWVGPSIVGISKYKDEHLSACYHKYKTSVSDRYWLRVKTAE